jgi:hypothetical protein
MRNFAVVSVLIVVVGLGWSVQHSRAQTQRIITGELIAASPEVTTQTGVRFYLVRDTITGPASDQTERLDAELRVDEQLSLGEVHEQSHTQRAAPSSAEIAQGMQGAIMAREITKSFTWNGDTIGFTSVWPQGDLTTMHNGVVVARGNSVAKTPPDPAAAAFFQDYADTLHLAGQIQRDLLDAVAARRPKSATPTKKPELRPQGTTPSGAGRLRLASFSRPAGAAEGCAAGQIDCIACSGPLHSGTGGGFTRTLASIAARNDANNNCSNIWCLGCCDDVGTDCYCQFGDTVCACVNYGHSCEWRTGCQTCYPLWYGCVSSFDCCSGVCDSDLFVCTPY